MEGRSIFFKNNFPPTNKNKTKKGPENYFLQAFVIYDVFPSFRTTNNPQEYLNDHSYRTGI